jgi:uncharacterized protein (TIGR02117 family)
MGEGGMRFLFRLLRGLAGIVMAYAVAVLVGGGIPANGDWTPAERGVRIYVIDNGVHTDLVLPADPFRDIALPGHFADHQVAKRRWLSFGWGDRDFYLRTPRWRDVNPLRVGKALVGAGSTVLHVAYLPEPRPGPHARAVTLRPEEYRRLVSYVRDSFAAGRVVRGYGRADAFYSAEGGYSVFRTCNEWTGAGLRRAGVRIGIWTPLPFNVTIWL